MLKTAQAHIGQILRAWDGAQTRDLLRRPGDFGLGQVPAAHAPDATTTSVCGFCSTGCGLKVHLKEGVAVNLSPETNYPVNLGMACPKGWEALNVLKADDRATHPLLRTAAGEMKRVDWHTAMTTFTDRFKAVQAQHGPESVAFISTGQIVTEEMCFLGALAKFGMGMLHGDGNTRQCMATAVAAYKESFGFDAPPYTYADFEESDVLVFIGGNPCLAHPIMWERVWRNPHQPDIIVLDPRRTETAAAATQHLALKPKSDLTLLYAVANLLLEMNAIDRDFIEKHTTAFDDFARHVQPYTPERAAAESGLSIKQIQAMAKTIAQGKRVSFWWTMGVNQNHEGTRIAQAIINLALMTGNIGRPGTGANSITGQCNAMGSRLFSNTTSLLGGHAFNNPQHRSKVAQALGMAPSCIPDQGSLAYDQILDGIDTGRIRGLWFVATNPAHSWIHQRQFRERLKKLDFAVVQDMYHSADTAQLADLVLPAAGWGEKEGTFINSERRIGRVKKVSRAPGEALADFHIFQLVAHYWGLGEQFKAFSSPAATFELMKDISAGQPCDITGIEGYDQLDACGGVQWPWSAADAQATSATGSTDTPGPDTERRLFADGRFHHPDGRARFVFDHPAPNPEPADDDYPVTLLTGRGTASQWHTQTRTGKSAVLRKLYPQGPYVEINPHDAAQWGIAAGTAVRVTSRRGSLVAAATLTHAVQPGQIFVPMHDVQTNQLTFPSFDPHSRQPSYKACAVHVARV